jgi:hypothetical protein
MKRHKILLLILATTFSPFLIAAILTSDYFSQQLGQKQYGTFLSEEIYLTDTINRSQEFQNKQWQLVISAEHKNYDQIINKLQKIKTALGKRSDRVNINISSVFQQPAKFESEHSNLDRVYIASPQGQVLLAYRNDQIGKPLFKDLSHLLRSNNL